MNLTDEVRRLLERIADPFTSTAHLLENLQDLRTILAAQPEPQGVELEVVAWWLKNTGGEKDLTGLGSGEHIYQGVYDEKILLCRLTDAQHPLSTERAEAEQAIRQHAEVVRIESELRAEAERKMAEKDAEIAELRELLSEKVISGTMLTEFVARNGGLTIGLEGGACALLAHSFGQQLYESDAVNYIEATFESPQHPDMGQITVTLKRETGKTPHQMRMFAEQERDQLRARVAELETDVSKWKALTKDSQRIAEIATTSHERMARLNPPQANSQEGEK